jgi:uncharacterized membrane protein
MIVFCTTCKGRTEHLAKTLPRNIADNADYPNCKFVVLDYGDPGDLQAYLSSNHAPDILTGRVVVYSYRTTAPFHVAHAKNMAARCGILEGADILVTLDADNFTGPGFAQHIANRFSAEDARPSIFLVPNHLYIQSLPHGPGRPCRGFAGRLAVRAQDFIKMGGYDEAYNTWRGEDIDLMFRLMRSGYEIRHIDNCYLNAIPHNAAVRFKEYPEARQYENPDEVKAIRARTETVVNYGQFGIGSVYHNFGSAPIDLGPVPTRIFGIGLHKTGTTSLHAAMAILGLDSFHWGSGEAPKIWQEVHSTGTSKTLEQWYALSDLPIPILYKKLDAAYPGSKFILTVRNEEKWLTSVERLWDPRYNPTRYIWDIWPFTHRVHKALYGRETFDRQVFLERYRSHNAEVVEYFRYRSGDLLVMNFDAGAGWAELCGFLGAQVPDVPYPTRNPSIALVQGRIESAIAKQEETAERMSLIETRLDYAAEDVEKHPILPTQASSSLPEPDSFTPHGIQEEVRSTDPSEEFLKDQERRTAESRETNWRSLIKAVSYRILGSAFTGLIVLVLTGGWGWAVGAGLLDAFLKIGAYFVHERIWNRIDFGRRQHDPGVGFLDSL